MSQLNRLAEPFDARLIEQKGGHDYVSHSSVTERALATVGPYSIEQVQLVAEPDGKVSGALVTICCEVDGRTVRITEAGESENPTSKTNGAKAKDAISDAVKRCWMRLGLGLHLWSGKAYVLNQVLDRDTGFKTPPEPPEPVVPTVVTPEPGEAAETPVEAQARPNTGANPVWMAWRKADDAVLWAGDQTAADGMLFSHHNHAQASFSKAKDEYSNSLTDAEKPKADDSHEAKWKHARALFKYFFERTEAKKQGEKLVLPTAGSQRIFEDIDEGDAVPFEQLGKGDYQNVPPGPQGT